MKINWRYTIGEILIVIIGITIAFSLNNWKQNRNQKSEKKQYLESLKQDIEQEILVLENNQKKTQEKIALIKQLRIELKEEGHDKMMLLKKFFDIPIPIDFTPNNTTYQTLIHSGDMKLIEDFQLRMTIAEHYTSHQEILKHYERIEKINEKYIADFYMYKINPKEIADGSMSFLYTPLLTNIINSMAGAYTILLKGNETCLASNKKLLQTIEESLAN